MHYENFYERINCMQISALITIESAISDQRSGSAIYLERTPLPDAKSTKSHLPDVAIMNTTSRVPLNKPVPKQ